MGIKMRKMEIGDFSKISELAKSLGIDPMKLTDYILKTGIEVLTRSWDIAKDEFLQSVKEKIEDYYSNKN